MGAEGRWLRSGLDAASRRAARTIRIVRSIRSAGGEPSAFTGCKGPVRNKLLTVGVEARAPQARGARILGLAPPGEGQSGEGGTALQCATEMITLVYGKVVVEDFDLPVDMPEAARLDRRRLPQGAVDSLGSA